MPERNVMQHEIKDFTCCAITHQREADRRQVEGVTLELACTLDNDHRRRPPRRKVQGLPLFDPHQEQLWVDPEIAPPPDCPIYGTAMFPSKLRKDRP